MQKLRRWIRDNSLSLSFFVLFVAALAAQTLAGFHSYTQKLADNGRSPIELSSYLRTGNFLDAIFANWQGAILQLGCLIVFAVAFRQKGAPHSRKSKSKKKGNRHREPWFYRNSLSIAFTACFLASFVAHVVFGTWSYNETQVLTRQPPVAILTYLRSANCWYKILQTWQAEFFGIGLYIVLSIFLRQEGSAESKPTESGDGATGETNQ